MRKHSKQHHQKYNRLLSALLCAALLCALTTQPSSVYAAVEEVDDADGAAESENNENTEAADVAAGETADEAVDEPASSAEQAVNAEISTLQNQIAKVNSTLESYKAEQKQIEAEIQSAKSEKEKAEKQRNNYSYQISLTQNEIASLAEKISLLEQDIVEKQEGIEKKQNEIDSTYELFKQRLKAKYMQDNGSMLGLLLGSDSFSEFLTRSEHMARIGQHDREVMSFLTIERVAIEEDKAALEETKEQVEADRAEEESKKQELAVKHTEAQKQVHSAEADEAAFKADLAKNQAQQAQMKAEIDNLYKQIEFVKTPYAGGSMKWPLPGYSSISSHYGPRFGGTDYHTGVDITGSGCHGSTIVAANSGKVSFVNYGNTGYGIYVIIDHGVNDNGQNISTLYAHCSAILVSQNQEVNAGDPIAQVGSTGWSTGPHLHFEVRVGTQHVSPGPYIGVS